MCIIIIIIIVIIMKAIVVFFMGFDIIHIHPYVKFIGCDLKHWHRCMLIVDLRTAVD